jgi:hypothetical protein
MKKVLIASIAGLALVGGYVAAQGMPMGNMDDHIKQMKDMNPEQIKAIQEQMQKIHANGSMPMMKGQMMQGQMMEQNANMKIMRGLMTPAERLAMMDKMMDAKTVEERQAIMTTTHAEMEKRAKDKGITLPAGHGPQMMPGKMCG